MDDPALFALTVLAILATPGPTNTLLTTAGATSGIRRALPLIPAEAAGYLIAISTLGLLLGPLVAASPALGMGLRLVVGLYLLSLAWRLWQGANVLTSANTPIITPTRIFTTTLLNPKAIIFALGVVPFEAANVGLYLTGFAALTAMVALGWIGIGTAMGRVAAASGRTRIVPRVGATVVSTFAVMLLTSAFLR